jgi:HD-GYP domain-containing protein (c-di-GMP phosphodiesterase class II)
MSKTIAVEDLRVGMYIQLDGGWLSHPFALSNFRISAPEQISTLRRLGLARVRWEPAKSDLTPPPAPVGGTSQDAVGGEAAQAPEAAAGAAAASRRNEWLAAQREAAHRCERQHAEAAKAWREAQDIVTTNPEQAGRTTTALAQAMLDKMLDADDVAIRLVGGGADRAAAHALNVAVVSMLVGRALGLSAKEMVDLGVGALAHDVGKIDVADRFRHAEDGLSPAELSAYREHVVKGVQHGQRMELAPDALAVLAQHHEHANGSGFPQHLNADRMTIAARIVTIVNCYDNLCNPGTRVPALTPHEAVATLFAQGRSRFDATVLNIFIRMMGVYPVGSLVQLTDDRFAMVIGVNSSRPLKPRVVVADAMVGRCGRADEALQTELIDLEQEGDLGIRRSLGPAKLPPLVLQALDPRPRVQYYFEPVASHRLDEEQAA